MIRALSKRLRADQVGWVNFYTLYFFGYIVSGLLGGIVIAVTDGLSYLDGFFCATSAVTGSSLATVTMAQLTLPSFTIICILMFLGQPLMAVGLYPCLARMLKTRLGGAVLLKKTKRVAIEKMFWIKLSYIVLWHALLIPALIGALYLKPHSEELAARHYTREAEAFFMVISSFANAGYCLTSDGLAYLYDNPLAYLIIALSTVAGGVHAPPFLRAYIECLKWITINIFRSDPFVYKELLKNSEEYSCFLFNQKSSLYLFGINFFIHMVQFAFFCFSTLVRPDAVAYYGGVTSLAGIGFFQSISTRYAGLQIMTFNFVSNGMLVIYGACACTYKLNHTQTPSYDSRFVSLYSSH